MSQFSKTRAAAEYVALHGRSEPSRARAGVLLARLATCKAALEDGNGSSARTGNGPQPTVDPGTLRALVLAARDLVGRAWLKANADDPDVEAFVAMCNEAVPPDAEEIDRTCSAVLWARFAPGGGSSDPGSRPAQTNLADR